MTTVIDLMTTIAGRVESAASAELAAAAAAVAGGAAEELPLPTLVVVNLH